MWSRIGAVAALLAFAAASAVAQTSATFPLPQGAAPSGLAADNNGAIWFASRHLGAVGRLDPETGHTYLLALGHGAQPSSLVLGPGGALFATDAVANLVYQVDPGTNTILRHPIDGPGGPLELNGAVFDERERLWFSGYSGYLGWLEPLTGRSEAIPAPGGRGAIGITSTGGAVWLVSYTTNSLIRVDTETLVSDVFPIPSGHEGARTVAASPAGDLWLTASQSGTLLRLRPKSGFWQSWVVPGEEARPYGLAFDRRNSVIVSDTGQSMLHVFDSGTQAFTHEIGLAPDCMPRTIVSVENSIWAAEARCDQIRLVASDQLR
jgi:streptogramin lyase